MTPWKWKKHDDRGRPDGISDATIVEVRIADDLMTPMRADELDWHCPSDPVTMYRVLRLSGDE